MLFSRPWGGCAVGVATAAGAREEAASAVGEDLRSVVGKCDVLLAIIGEQWLTVRGKEGRRLLDDPEDFVRLEIQSALEQSIPVVPVLVGRAVMPSEQDLPDVLKELAYRN